MQKKLIIDLALVCTLMVGAPMMIPEAAEAGDVKVTVSCPATITNGATLNLGLTLQNTSMGNVTIANSAVAIHLGNLRVSGPSVVPLSLTLAPEGTTGDATTIPNYLSAAFPRATRGTFSSVGVAVMNSANKPIGEDWCNIEVR